jgi:hypothetical protein
VVFNEAWNTTVAIIKDMLDNNQIPAPTDWTVKQAFKTELKKQLPTSQSAFTDGQCYGAGINISWPKYCDNRPRESI